MDLGIGQWYQSFSPANPYVGMEFPGRTGEDEEIPGQKKAEEPDKSEKVDRWEKSDIMENCTTCANRRYQDGSDDASVSFKSPTKLSPEVAARAVRAHENEHVVNEQANAKREGGEVVSQSVAIFTAVCPECKKTYVSGGETRTTVRYGADGKEKSDVSADVGKKLNMVA